MCQVPISLAALCDNRKLHTVHELQHTVIAGRGQGDLEDGFGTVAMFRCPGGVDVFAGEPLRLVIVDNGQLLRSLITAPANTGDAVGFPVSTPVPLSLGGGPGTGDSAVDTSNVSGSPLSFLAGFSDADGLFVADEALVFAAAAAREEKRYLQVFACVCTALQQRRDCDRRLHVMHVRLAQGVIRGMQAMTAGAHVRGYDRSRWSFVR